MKQPSHRTVKAMTFWNRLLRLATRNRRVPADIDLRARHGTWGWLTGRDLWTPDRPPRVGRWDTYMGRFSVPPLLFWCSPRWLHRAADWCGGVEPSPWTELRTRLKRKRKS